MVNCDIIIEFVAEAFTDLPRYLQQRQVPVQQPTTTTATAIHLRLNLKRT